MSKGVVSHQAPAFRLAPSTLFVSVFSVAVLIRTATAHQHNDDEAQVNEPVIFDEPVPVEPDAEPSSSATGEEVVTLIDYNETWAQDLANVAANQPFVVAKNPAGRTCDVLPTGELVARDGDNDIPTPADFPLRTVKGSFVTKGAYDELRHATAPPASHGPSQPEVPTPKGPPQPKTLAAPPARGPDTVPVPTYASTIRAGNINIVIYPHAGGMSPVDWRAKWPLLRSTADIPTTLVKTFFGKEMIIRAVGAPRVELPQPFLPEGPRSAAVGIVVETRTRS